MDTASINYSLLHPGATISYRLLPTEHPTNPHKIWYGRVIRWQNGAFLLVEVLEPGHRGLSEFVRIDQIIAVSEEA